MGVLGGNPFTQMVVLDSRFQYEDSNYMVVEAVEEHALDSAEAAYEYPGEQAPIGFMSSGEVFHDENDSRWWNQKHASLTNHTCSENTNREIAAVCMSVAKYTIRKETVRVIAPLECWGCTNPPYTKCTGYKLTVTSPKRWIQTWRSVRSGQLKSTPNSI